jgi:fructokinase
MKYRIVGLGEVLWDELPAGRQLGGAPANFAYHAGALGADARVVSRVGRDDLGRDLIARLEELGISTACIELDAERPTGTVSVELSADGQPRYLIHENVAWDALHGDEPAHLAESAAHAVCFGTLAQRDPRSRQTIRTLLAEAPRVALRIFDINLRQDYYSRAVIEDSLGWFPPGRHARSSAQPAHPLRG